MKTTIEGLGEFTSYVQSNERFNATNASMHMEYFDTRQIAEDLNIYPDCKSVRLYPVNRDAEMFRAFGKVYRDVEIEISPGHDGLYIRYSAQLVGGTWQSGGSLAEGGKKKMHEAFDTTLKAWYGANLVKLQNEARDGYKKRLKEYAKNMKDNARKIEEVLK